MLLKYIFEIEVESVLLEVQREGFLADESAGRSQGWQAEDESVSWYRDAWRNVVRDFEGVAENLFTEFNGEV